MKPKLHLESLEQLGWRFGLQTIQALLDELSHPELTLQVVHVAGSNGKGSTCAFMASFLKLCGYKTGLYTSPHLCDVRERFRLNGEWISQNDFNRHAQRVLRACLQVQKKLGHLPTHFEALTAIAFSWFEEQKVDWVVLEVGLGGRLDATNIIPSPAVSLIAPVGLEHENILGKTLGKIAREKAGILKEGCLAATVQYHQEAAKAIDGTAREKGAKLWLAGRDFIFRKESEGFSWEGPGLIRRFKLPEIDDFQLPNAALAVAGIQCLKTFGISQGSGIIEKSLEAMRWPGRVEEVSRKPLVVLDGAHNPQAAKALLLSIRNRYPNKHWVVLSGFLSDKNYRSFTKILAPLTDLSIVTAPFSERAEKGSNVFQAWEKSGVKTILIQNWEKAFAFSLSKTRQANNLGLLITGSLYLVGACRKCLVGLKGLKTI